VITLTVGISRSVNLSISYTAAPEYSLYHISFSNMVLTSIHNSESGDSGAPVATYHVYMGVYDGDISGDGYSGGYFSRAPYIQGTTTVQPVAP